MDAKILKVESKASHYGGSFYYVFFKSLENGKSFRTCVDPKLGNYRRWREVLKPGLILSNLKTKTGTLIGADSIFEIKGFEEIKDERRK